MSEISRLFEALYSHFLLRDIVAKVLPGLLGLFSVILTIAPNASRYISQVSEKNSLVLIVVLYAVGLMFGMALQFIGSCLRIIRIHVWEADKGRTARQISIENDVELHHRADPSAPTLRKRERMAVFKEMAGNYSIALFLSALAVVARAVLSRQPPFVPYWALIVIVLLGIVLVLQNRNLASEQKEWEEKLLEVLRRNAAE